MIPLGQIETGGTGKVTEILGGRGVVQRLIGMGIRQGTAISVIQSGGPVILETGGNRLVIGVGMVNNIMIEPD